jgi:hypothetical protein
MGRLKRGLATAGCMQSQVQVGVDVYLPSTLPVVSCSCRLLSHRSLWLPVREYHSFILLALHIHSFDIKSI